MVENQDLAYVKIANILIAGVSALLGSIVMGMIFWYFIDKDLALIAGTLSYIPLSIAYLGFLNGR